VCTMQSRFLKTKGDLSFELDLAVTMKLNSPPILSGRPKSRACRPSHYRGVKPFKMQDEWYFNIVFDPTWRALLQSWSPNPPTRSAKARVLLPEDRTSHRGRQWSRGSPSLGRERTDGGEASALPVPTFIKTGEMRTFASSCSMLSYGQPRWMSLPTEWPAQLLRKNCRST
jgi:hypothetical protein